jgi:hypothetical protein
MCSSGELKRNIGSLGEPLLKHLPSVRTLRARSLGELRTIQLSEGELEI